MKTTDARMGIKQQLETRLPLGFQLVACWLPVLRIHILCATQTRLQDRIARTALNLARAVDWAVAPSSLVLLVLLRMHRHSRQPLFCAGHTSLPRTANALANGVAAAKRVTTIKAENGCSDVVNTIGARTLSICS